MALLPRSQLIFALLAELFSAVESFDFPFGRQLPCECAGLLGTGTYPGQQRELLLSAMTISLRESHAKAEPIS